MHKGIRIASLSLALLAGTASAQFCPGASPFVFNDVLASDPFCGYVTWMAQKGVTLGCQVIDANNRLYCPTDSVRRDQMAAFMSRLGDALFPSTCAAGQVMKWNGLAWTCADDALGGSGGGGTVTSVAASTGLAATPNPITGAGTMSVAPSYRLPQSCAANQVPKWIGGAWTCADDALGGGGGGGTVTSVLAGTGLTASPNPITGAGSINLAPSYQLPQACANGQVAKSNGTGGWTCAADNNTNSGGTVTSLTQGSGIVLAPNPVVGAGTISADTAYLQRRVSASCAAGSSIRAIAADGGVTCEVDSGTGAFVQGGNAFGVNALLGTTDNFSLELGANGVRVMRYEPNAISPNVIGGNPANNVTAGVRGATIAGGGVAAGNTDPDYGVEAPNRVTDHYGTVAGGFANQAGDAASTTGNRAFSTVGGGRGNTASGFSSTVGGGGHNTASGYTSTVGGGGSSTASGDNSTVGGGAGNTASGDNATVGGGEFNTASNLDSTVSGGAGNIASGDSSTVGGGYANWADGSYSTVGGGLSNFAAGYVSTVVGGRDNDAAGDYSVAMGRRAKAMGNGSFSFADSNNFDFSANSVNAFRVRATGGVRFVTDIDATGAVTWSCLAVAGAGWACASDRNLKHSLVELDARAVLDKVAALPVYQWQPKGQNAHVLHYGPMAQDFHAAFGLGDDDKMIGMQDADGVALAAIKGLNEKVEAQAQEIAALKRLVEQLIAAP